MMNSYVELVRRRLEDRGNNILGNLERFMEPQLRFTMRIFGDCLDEETRGTMFSGYSEHLAEQELRAFAADFVPAYNAYAIAELEEKKKDGETIFGDVAGALGAPPSSPPQAVKGGSCGGEEEDWEFNFTGSMLSATWEFPKGRRDAVVDSFRGLFGLTDGPS